MSEPAAARLSCRAGIARAGISRAGCTLTALDKMAALQENSTQDTNRWARESETASSGWTLQTLPPV